MKKLIVIILAFVVLSSCSSNSERDMFFHTVVKGMKEKLPMKADDATDFFSVDYNSKENKFTYYYTITDESIANIMIDDNKAFIDHKEPQFVAGINDKSNPFFQKAIECKTTIVYSYKTNSGDKILDIVMTPEKYTIK